MGTPRGSFSGCFICKSSEDNELLFGKFYSKWRLRVHYYCLLLTSNLVQNGESDEVGIFGFLQEDICNEEARIKSQKCYICKERYANISCCAKKCFRTFHTVCGIKHGCLSHYIDTFQSWCDKHVELNVRERHTESESCAICYEEMGVYSKLESIHAPCCHNGWFHRRCAAQFAQSAGYFFKCPLCNNKEEFANEIMRRGVYVPEKDASWELEPNAFNDQLERPSKCDAEECRCRFGRDYDTSKWDLIICATCGSTCRHDQCMEVPSKNYVCTFCKPIVGDEPPPAVLALAEASRRAEAARRAAVESSSDDESRDGNARGYESGIHSPSSSNGSTTSIRPTGRGRKRLVSSDSTVSSSSEIRPGRNHQRKRRLLSSDSSESTSNIRTNRKSKKSSRFSSSSNLTSSSLHNDLHNLIKRFKLSVECSEKLLKCKPIVKVEKLTADYIKSLTSDNEDASSTSSSTIFDFNYRVKQNKKRRKSMDDLRSIKDAIRSDTDTLTDASLGKEISRAKTPSQKAFSKQFKLKLLVSKSAFRKRVNSTSDSDGEQPAKKPYESLEQPASKSRVSLFPANDVENTCPNSPHKPTIVPISEGCPSPCKDKLALSSIPSPHCAAKSVPRTDTVLRAGTNTGADSKSAKNQKTLSSFFKMTSPETEVQLNTSGHSSGGGATLNAGGSCKKSAKKGLARKKFTELDRGQRNLLDYFNRC